MTILKYKKSIVNKMKGIYIGMYMPFTMGISGYAIYNILETGFSYIWLSVLITSVPILMLISMLMMFKYTARTSAHFPIISSLVIAGSGLAIYSHFFLRTEPLPFALTMAGAFTFFIYNFWYSDLGRQLSHTVFVNKKLPVFTAQDSNGKEISSDSFLGHPCLYMFYRGNWCPLCMAQIKEIVKKYTTLNDMGVQVVLISPQPENNSTKLANKYKVPFIFLTDKNNKAATMLNIDMINGLPAGMEMMGYDSDTVYPTVIATDEAGKIIYIDQTDNYRIRPEPETFIQIFKQAIA